MLPHTEGRCYHTSARWKGKLGRCRLASPLTFSALPVAPTPGLELGASTRQRKREKRKGKEESERRIKELTFAADEDRKNHERMQSLIDGLQGKIRSYKKQIEEAEEIAALNLAMFRKTQGEVGDAGQRADLNEQALAKSKARGRSCSIGPQ